MESTRRFTRIECNNQSSVEIGNVAVIEAKILNISLNGVLFELKQERLFNKGEKWRLKFKLPESDIVGNFETEVMHSHGNRVGLKFLHADVDAMAHVSRLLEADTKSSNRFGNSLSTFFTMLSFDD